MTMTVSDRGMARDQHMHACGLFRAHARGGLIEQQHLRPAGERQRDFELALAAVAEVPNRGAEHVGKANLRRNLVGLHMHRGALVHRLPEYPCRSCPQRAGERKIVPHREVGKQVVALERTRNADARPARHIERGYVTAGKVNGAVIRPQVAGKQVEIGGLARTVRTDDGVAKSRFENETDALRDGQRAERLVELTGLKRDHDAASVPPAAGTAARVRR